MSDDRLTYENLVDDHPVLEKVVHKQLWDHAMNVSSHTAKAFQAKWAKNIRKNVPKLYRKHGPISEACGGIGINKAIIAIGAGPSFNLNKHVLKRLSDANMQLPLDEQPFIFMVSNHQLKPCLQMGIYPHFVLLIEASDVVFTQMCQGLTPPLPILLTSLHTSPRVLNAWEKQGGHIRFYCPKGEEEQQAFRETAGEEPDAIMCEQGGNVLNQAWIFSLKWFGSKVFMSVGNDLAFPHVSDVEKRRAEYYADGDYTSNIKNKRDEASKNLAWMGFKFTKSLITDDYLCDLELMSTSLQMYSYKIWLESQVAANYDKGIHYFNCSEQGILGMCAKSLEPHSMKDRNNWYLLDHDKDIGKVWHTRRLEDAARLFIGVRQCAKEGTPFGAGAGISEANAMDIVRTVEEDWASKSAIR